MLDSPDFKYDVAFSFLARDESFAVQISDLLKGRCRTFLYSDSERQTLLAGRDGEEVLSRVYGKESRIVVILYRTGWGGQGFTAVEASAIRNRAYEHGYDFTSVIPLDDPPVPPVWLPKTRLWHGLTRWGVEGAAAAIESRLEELGTEPREETIEVMTSRILRQAEDEQQRRAFLDSAKGVMAAREECGLLVEALRAQASRTSGMVIWKVSEGGIAASLECNQRRVNVVLDLKFGGTLDESALRLTYVNLRIRLGILESGHPQWDVLYNFAVDARGQHGWRRSKDDDRFMTSSVLAEHVVRELLMTLEQ